MFDTIFQTLLSLLSWIGGEVFEWLGWLMDEGLALFGVELPEHLPADVTRIAGWMLGYVDCVVDQVTFLNVFRALVAFEILRFAVSVLMWLMPKLLSIVQVLFSVVGTGISAAGGLVWSGIKAIFGF